MKSVFLSLTLLFAAPLALAMEPEESKTIRDAQSLKANCARFLLKHPEINRSQLPEELREYIEFEGYVTGQMKEFCIPGVIQSALHYMMEHSIKNILLMRYLKALNPTFNLDTPIQKDSFGKLSLTPLMVALIKKGDHGFAKFLLECGANINYQPSEYLQLCALHWAADEGNIPMTQFLLAQGANPLLKNFYSFVHHPWPAIEQPDSHQKMVAKNIFVTVC